MRAMLSCVVVVVAAGCSSKPEREDPWVAVAKKCAAHAELECARPIGMPPTNMPWGLREMHVADPDGNVIRFGHHAG